MRALTLWQPWASIVASGVKLIENRSWAPPGWLLGERFAIHAGKRYDHKSALAAGELGAEVPSKNECPLGAIVATCELLAVARTKREAVRFSGDPSQQRWFFGKYGWVLENIVAVTPPIECRGWQGLWTLDPTISAVVKRLCK